MGGMDRAGRISAADPRHFMQPVEPGHFAEEIQARESSGAVALLQSGYAITLGAILLICHELLPWLRPRKAR